MKWALFDEANGRFTPYVTLQEVKKHIENLEYDNGDLYLLKIVAVFEDGEKRGADSIIDKRLHQANLRRAERNKEMGRH
jgi:hypothetical protein